MVRKVLSAVALASVVAATPAMAQTGGFTGPGATQEGTVAHLKRFPMTLTDLERQHRA